MPPRPFCPTEPVATEIMRKGAVPRSYSVREQHVWSLEVESADNIEGHQAGAHALGDFVRRAPAGAHCDHEASCVPREWLTTRVARRVVKRQVAFVHHGRHAY